MKFVRDDLRAARLRRQAEATRNVHQGLFQQRHAALNLQRGALQRVLESARDQRALPDPLFVATALSLSPDDIAKAGVDRRALAELKAAHAELQEAETRAAMYAERYQPLWTLAERIMEGGIAARLIPESMGRELSK